MLRGQNAQEWEDLARWMWAGSVLPLGVSVPLMNHLNSSREIGIVCLHATL